MRRLPIIYQARKWVRFPNYRATLFRFNILSPIAGSNARYYISLFPSGSLPGKTAVHHPILQIVDIIFSSVYWLRYLQDRIVDLKTHFLSLELPSSLACLPLDLHDYIQSRSMLVRRLKMFPIESIVRGYLTGTA